MVWKQLIRQRYLGCVLAALTIGGLAASADAQDIYQLSSGSGTAASNAFFQLPTVTASGNILPSTLASTYHVNTPGTSQPQGAGLFYMDRNSPSGSSGLDWIQDVGNQSTSPASAAVGSWYWIGIGTGATAQALGTEAGVTSNFIPEAGNALRVQYTTNDVLINLTATLTSTSVYQSDLTRQISIKNLSSSSVNIQFYGLTNLALTQLWNGTSWSLDTAQTNQTVSMSNPYTIQQVNAFNADNGGGAISAATDTLDAANNPNAIAFGNAQDLLNAFNGGLTSLSTNTASYTGNDPAFAFMYNLNLASNQIITIKEDLAIVPEPASLVLLAIGATLIGLPRRRERQ